MHLRLAILGENHRRLIYEDRPLACRRSSLRDNSKKAGVGKRRRFLRHNTHLIAMLDRW